MNNESIIPVAIIDDDAIATEALKEEIGKYPQLAMVGCAATCAEGTAMVAERRPRLLFLDVELPDATGMEFLRAARGLLPGECHVIFYTAHDKYAINALRAGAFDFITKPIDPREMALVVSRALEDISMPTGSAEPQPMVISMTNGDMLVLKPDDIFYFLYDEQRRLWSVKTADGQIYSMRRSVKSEAIMQYSEDFIQTDKAHIINVRKLTAVREGACVIRCGDAEETLSISRAKVMMLKGRFKKL